LLILGVVIGSNNLAVALALGALGQAGRRFRVMLGIRRVRVRDAVAITEYEAHRNKNERNKPP
jgi:hypothetical protein